MAADERLVAFTRERAADLSGLTPRQLDYWRKTQLMQPSTSRQVSEHRSVHLYDFTDMLELLTIAELLRRNVPTRRVRKIVDRLRARGYERPLTEIRFGVIPLEGRRERVLVMLKHADGSVEGDDHPDQAIFREAVDMTEIRATLRRSTERRPERFGQVERRRGALGSKELFAGTRIPVATVRSYLREGVAVGEILEAFPALTAEDIEAARLAAS